MASLSVDSPCGTPRLNRVLMAHKGPGEIEAKFLHAVDFGDIVKVREMLEEFPDLNVDCTDNLGRTPLRLAVKNENKELMETLLDLSNAENMNAAVLQAIDSASTAVAEIALRHPRYQDAYKRMRRMGETDNFFKPELGSQFPSYVTPLSLAAQKNHFPIVQLLLQRGDTITPPHKLACICQECINKNKFDQLRFAQCRLDSYRGLASEAYISLYSKDPFLTAFELAHELRNLAMHEVCFKPEYTALADQLSDYTVKLLDRVWTQRELTVVLDKTVTGDRFDSLARLKLAIGYEEKLFVSHPNCQQRIARFWHSGLGWLGRANWLKRILMLPVGIVTYPVAVGFFLAAPESRLGKFVSQPAMKFLSHTISFFIFLLLIIISSTQVMGESGEENSLAYRYPDLHHTYNEFRQVTGKMLCGENFPLRSQKSTATEILIMIWVLGLIVQECQEISQQGYQEHFRDKFNIWDFLLLSVYTASFCVRMLVMIKVGQGLDWLEHGNVTADESATETHVYWLNGDRIWWTDTDPINMAEGLFAMANILSFSRIAYIMPANESLGPLQISLGRMINDILKFFALAIIVIAAFMVGLRNLFWYYANRHTIELNPDKIPDPDVVSSYGSEKATFRTVFWAIYGRSSARGVSLGEYNNTVTEDIGQSIDAMYHIVMIIVMLNILIAMMSRSFELIQCDSDTEWKFARTALFMDYIKEGNVLPVPLNVLEPLQLLLQRALRYHRERKQSNGPGSLDSYREEPPHRDSFASTLDTGQGPSWKRQRFARDTDIEMSEGGNSANGNVNVAFMSRKRLWSQHGLNQYQEVIQSIIQRYIFDIQRQNEITGAGIEDLKNSFERLRIEVLKEFNEKDEAICMALETVEGISKEVDQCQRSTARRRALYDRNPSLKRQPSQQKQASSPILQHETHIADVEDVLGLEFIDTEIHPDAPARHWHTATAKDKITKKKMEVANLGTYRDAIEDLPADIQALLDQSVRSSMITNVAQLHNITDGKPHEEANLGTTSEDLAEEMSGCKEKLPASNVLVQTPTSETQLLNEANRKPHTVVNFRPSTKPKEKSASEKEKLSEQNDEVPTVTNTAQAPKTAVVKTEED